MNHKKNDRNKKVTNIYLGIATFLFLVAITAILWVMQSKQYVSDELFASYYQLYQPTLKNNETPTNINPEAYYSYINADYKRSYPLLKAQLNTEPDNITSLFYAGLVAIEMKDYYSSITYLQKVPRYADHNYYYHAQWYLAMVYLKLEDNEKATRVLHEIIKDNELYREQAKKLVSKLN